MITDLIDGEITEVVEAEFLRGLRFRIDPDQDRIWICTNMRWINAFPIFEFIKEPLVVSSFGLAEFSDPRDEITFCQQLGFLTDRPCTDELFPNLKYPREIVDQIRLGVAKLRVPVWFVSPDDRNPPRVNVLWADNPFYHQWCISTRDDDPATTILYNPVRIDRKTFQRTIEAKPSENLPVMFI